MDSNRARAANALQSLGLVKRKEWEILAFCTLLLVRG